MKRQITWGCVMMELIYRAISSFALGIAVLFFYRKILADKSIGRVCWVSISLCFTVYMLFVRIVVPIQIIGGILALWLLLRIFQQGVNLAALMLAFLFGYFLWFTSVFIATPVGILFGEGTIGAILMLLATEMLIYFIAHKLIKLKNGMPYINTPGG